MNLHGKKKLKNFSDSREPMKVLSRVEGLDEITGGGVLKGRPILVSGGPGCRKALPVKEFILEGSFP